MSLKYSVFIVGIADLQNRAAVETVVAVATEHRYKATIRSSPPCGKICSYNWDAKKEGRYYPLLYKDVNCTNTIYRMANNPDPVILPPPRRPPTEMIRNFTIGGKCPFVASRYYDGTPSSMARRNHSNALAIGKFLKKNMTGRRGVIPAFQKYRHFIRDKSTAVVGTVSPWVEAILLNFGARNVTTIEYREITIDDKRVKTITPSRLAEQFINGKVVPFDTVITISSLEHSGLGRYGDPISPFGDLEATAQVWCMVKPGGHFILTVPVSDDRKKCTISWNGMRLYGAARLQHLTANWRVLDEFNVRDRHNHRTFVLEKYILADQL